MKKILFLFLLGCTVISAQERSGIYAGLNFITTSHENPYVYFTGSETSPGPVQGFSDNTTQLYVPFGWAGYSKNGFGEVQSLALHFLVVGVVNLLNPNKQYEFSTDHTYSGDSFADGYIPVFSNFVDNTSQYWQTGTQKGIEASYYEMDLFRFAGATNELTSSISLPFFLGIQGGIGQFGVHFAEVQEGHEPGDANNDGPGLVNFNEGVDLYFGVNAGYAMEFAEYQLALLSLQYDWHYFIKGADETQINGNRITAELTYFPFDPEKFWGNVFFKGFVKRNSVPFMKDFAKDNEVVYSNTSIGLGVSIFLF